MKSYKIREDVLTETLNYLATQPFSQVSGIIAKIQKSAEEIVEENVPEKVESKKKK